MTQASHIPQSKSLYDRLGGETGIRAFVKTLYEYMQRLPEVRPVRDLHQMGFTEAGERLNGFLSGWLGGPRIYHETWGEPRLRRRHLHIPIGDAERDQWMLCAQRAAIEQDWPAAVRDELLQRLQGMADHLRNQNPIPGRESAGSCGPGADGPAGGNTDCTEPVQP